MFGSSLQLPFVPDLLASAISDAGEATRGEAKRHDWSGRPLLKAQTLSQSSIALPTALMVYPV